MLAVKPLSVKACYRFDYSPLSNYLAKVFGARRADSGHKPRRHLVIQVENDNKSTYRDKYLHMTALFGIQAYFFKHS